MMKHRIPNRMCLLLAIILGATLLFNEVGAAAPKPAMKEKHINKDMPAVQTFVKILTTLHQDNGEPIWNKYDISASPVILWLDSGNIYAFNLNAVDPAWKSLDITEMNVQYATEDPWGVREVEFQPEFTIEGQTALVFHMRTDSPTKSSHPFFVFVHERFHHFQEEHFKTMRPKEAYEDHLSVENLTLMRLEENALVDFLRSSGDGKMDALKDFVAIHHKREGIMSPASIQWEKHQQVMEGTADYVGRRALEEANIVMPFQNQMELANSLHAYSADNNIVDAAIKQRHYGMGATLGYALDYLEHPNWKKEVEQGKNLDELLASILNLSDQELAQRATKVLANADYIRIKSEQEQLVIAYQTSMHKLNEEYRSQEGVVVSIHIPKGALICGGGNHKTIYNFPDGSMVTVNSTSVAATAENTWQLAVDGMPFLWQGKEGEREFKVEKALSIQVDGDSYQLDDLIHRDRALSFSEISWEGEQSQFASVKNSGKIQMRDGKLCIEFI